LIIKLKPVILPNSNEMKKLGFIFVLISFMACTTSCSIFRKEKYGCPTAAVGAEKIAAGDPQALKTLKKSKYKGGKKF
jgi:hypothetical protein